MFYGAVRGTEALNDLFTAHRQSKDAPFEGETRIDELSASGIHEADPEISLDGETLYFAGERFAGANELNLYVSTRSCQ